MPLPFHRPARLVNTLVALGALAVCSAVQAQADERFRIDRFDVQGSRFLSAEDITRLTGPYIGPAQVFGDVQKALLAVEGAYRQAGFSAVQVIVPEQELTQGVVRFEVTEVPLGQISISGESQFSAENIRQSLPTLQAGQTPNGRMISQSVQLANENPAKQVEVVLSVGKTAGTVDADVKVKEEPVQRVFLTLDNTGTRSTGRTRAGIAYRHANLFDRDHVVTLAYTTSLDKPPSAKVDVLSAAYHLPLYDRNASLDLIYGYSNVSTSTQSGAPGASLGINGKGDIFALRYNHYLPRAGEYSSRWVAGFDWKSVKSSCVNAAGVAVTGTAGCVDFFTTPISLTYAGRLEQPKRLFDYSIGLSINLPLGSEHPYPTAAVPAGRDLYTLAAGNRKSRDDYSVLRLTSTYLQPLPMDWTLRVSANGQSSFGTALVSTEQLGLAGSTAVRGFLERVVTADSGIVAQIEAQTPELSPMLGLTQGKLQGAVFFDTGWGYLHNDNTVGGGQRRLASWGLGARYQWNKQLSLRVDAAQILDVRPNNTYRGSDPRTGGVLDDNDMHDWRVHANLTWAF
jgi:hemolysin activation/secretion protein